MACVFKRAEEIKKKRERKALNSFGFVLEGERNGRDGLKGKGNGEGTGLQPVRLQWPQSKVAGGDGILSTCSVAGLDKPGNHLRK